MPDVVAPEVSVIIPVYNEPANIRMTLGCLRDRLPADHEILVVFDDDHDTTLPVLAELGRAYSALHVVKNDVARGPSGALRTGVSRSRGRKVLVVMADLSDDLDAVPELLPMVPRIADIVCP